MWGFGGVIACDRICYFFSKLDAFLTRGRGRRVSKVQAKTKGPFFALVLPFAPSTTPSFQVQTEPFPYMLLFGDACLSFAGLQEM